MLCRAEMGRRKGDEEQIGNRQIEATGVADELAPVQTYIVPIHPRVCI